MGHSRMNYWPTFITLAGSQVAADSVTWRCLAAIAAKMRIGHINVTLYVQQDTWTPMSEPKMSKL